MNDKIDKAYNGFKDKIAKLTAELDAEYNSAVAAIKAERPRLKSMDKCTWAEIIEVIESDNVYVKLGDEKTVELYTGEKVKVKLISLKPHDELEDGSNAWATFMFIPDGEYEMNETNTNAGGWSESKMRNVYMPRFLKLLPDELQNLISPVVKSTAGVNTVDKLFLPSEAEITGKNEWSAKGEGEQYDYFKKNKLPSKWTWLRSPSPTSGTFFAGWSSAGYVGNNFASIGYRVSPCFCI